MPTNNKNYPNSQLFGCGVLMLVIECLYPSSCLCPLMQCFVVFLRGINVGGHIVVKEKLKEVFASMSFTNISTYKQSGNVIFETDQTNQAELTGKIQEQLRSALGFEVPVVLRTLPQLRAIIEQQPFKDQSSENTSFLVTFLPKEYSVFPLPLPATIPKSTAQIISANSTEVFSVTHGGGEGALPNPFLESKLKVKATTRNLNIVREITEKFG
jgi:uncharacterized protein (DUF1697 family)